MTFIIDISLFENSKLLVDEAVIFTKEFENYMQQFITDLKIDKEKVRDYAVANSKSQRSKGNKMIRELAKIDPNVLKPSVGFQESLNIIISNIKTAMEIGNEETLNYGDKAFLELNKQRHYIFKNTINAITDEYSKINARPLLNLFDEKMTASTHIKIYQLGLEEFAKQVSQYWKDFGHTFLHLWKGFQNETVKHIKLVLEQSEQRLTQLTTNITDLQHSVDKVTVQNQQLMEDNLKQAEMLQKYMEEFTKASMHCIYDEFTGKLDLTP